MVEMSLLWPLDKSTVTLFRIVVQNEKYEDWTFALIKLKTIFHEYKNTVLNFHAHPGVKLPRGYNSTAAEGNVLEVLNMSLNVFEKHTVDRNFERTGQMCVVITPSTGVFEVDRELLTLTKQKSIDYGIGNDLVFMVRILFAAGKLKHNLFFNNQSIKLINSLVNQTIGS